MPSRRQSPFAALALLAAVAVVACARGETVTGPAKVIDGDSLEIGATRIRLHAVDAFEGKQTCGTGAAAWRCGAAAANELRRLVGSAEVSCTRTDTDSYGRMVAICRSGGVDLGAAMVRSGLALAYREYGDDYVDEERAARAARRGAWAGEFVRPADERHAAGPRTRSADDAPHAAAPTATGSSPPSAGCRIKGNIAATGERIYHLPGSRSYDDTRIDESRGERWFCTEDDARRAGWRPPRG